MYIVPTPAGSGTPSETDPKTLPVKDTGTQNQPPATLPDLDLSTLDKDNQSQGYNHQKPLDLDLSTLDKSDKQPEQQEQQSPLQVQADIQNQWKPKYTSLENSYKIAPSKYGVPVATPPDDYKVDYSTTPLENINPDVARTLYSGSTEESEKMYANNRLPVLSKMDDDSRKVFMQKLITDNNNPTPLQNLVIPKPKIPVNDLFAKLKDATKSVYDNINDEKQLSSLEDTIRNSKDEGTAEETKKKYNELLNGNILFNIRQKYKGQPVIYGEQIQSDLQNELNERKYKILSESGFASPIDRSIPKTVRDVLMSDEYLNSSLSEKKVYAKMLYENNMQSFQDAGLDANTFYGKVANTFTPKLNAVLLKQIAKDNLPAAKASESAYNNNLDNYDMSGSPVMSLSSLMGRSASGKARSLYENIISSDYEDESTWPHQIKNALSNSSAFDYVPFLSGALDLSNSAELYRVSNQAKHNGVNSLNKEDRILYDASSAFNGYQDISRQGVMTKVFQSLPSLVSFFGELGLTTGASEFTSGLMKGYIKKTGTDVIEKAVPGAIESLKAINDMTGGSLKSVAKAATFLPSKALDISHQVLLGRSFETLDDTFKKLTGNPFSGVSYADSQILSEQLPPSETNKQTTLLRAFLDQGAQIGAADIGKAFEVPQNKLIDNIVSKYPKSIGWLNYLHTGDLAEQIGKATDTNVLDSKPTLFQNMLKQAKIGGVLPESAAFMIALPRAQHLIWNTKDNFYSNFPDEIKKDMSDYSGIIAPMILGRGMGIAESLYMKKVKYANEFAHADYLDKIFNADSTTFQSPEYQDALRKQREPFISSNDRTKSKLGQLMEGYNYRRLQHENGDIKTSDTTNTQDTYGSFKEYMGAAKESQTSMNELIDGIKNGNPDEEKLNDAIQKSADDGFRQEFQFHKALIDSYKTADTSDTLDEYVSKHKQDFNNIKDEFNSFDKLKSVPDWKSYSDRINSMPLPNTYKEQLNDSMNYLKEKWEQEKDKYLIPQDHKDKVNAFRIPGSDNDSHTFIKNSDGQYELKSNNRDKFIPDITHIISSMSMENVNILSNVVKNSNITSDDKVKISESIKEKILQSFEHGELLSDYGGINNFGQMLYSLNNVGETAKLNDEEKRTLTNTVGAVALNELMKDNSIENFDNVKSLLYTLVHNTNSLNVAEVLDLARSLQTRMKRVDNMRASIKDLAHSVTLGDDDARRNLENIVENPVEFKQDSGTDVNEDLKNAIELIKNKNVSQSRRWETLDKSNKNVSKISDTLDKLNGVEAISNNTKILLQGIISGMSIKHIDLRSISIKQTDEETAGSFYNPVTKTISLRYFKGKDGESSTPEYQIASEFLEELRHNIHHTLGEAIGSGGVSGNFIMTDSEINKIAGSTRTDAVANIARWYKAKDFDYSDYLRIKNKPFDSRTDDERRSYGDIRNMLDWYRERFKQKDRDNMNFVDDINRSINFSFTTESLVRNFNRWKELKDTGISSAASHYYSAYSHEYFAKTFGDSDIVDVSNRISGNKIVGGIIQSMQDWASEYIKVPLLQRMFRSELFSSNEAKKFLSRQISQLDINKMIKVSETPNATFNSDIKKDFELVSKSIIEGLGRESKEPIVELRNHISDIIKNSRINDLDKLYKNINYKVNELGYNDSFTNDLIYHIIKDSGITISNTYGPSIRRHSDTDEVEQNVNDSKDTPLNENGKKQAEDIGSDFERLKINKIFHSPTTRAKETAEIAANKSGVTDIQERNGLRTWDIGQFEGTSKDEFDEKHFVENPDEVVPSGESFNQFRERITSEREDLKNISDDKTGIISHSKVMKLWDALNLTDGEWNKKAIKKYLSKNIPDSVDLVKNDIETPNWNVGFKNIIDYIRDTQSIIKDSTRDDYTANNIISSFRGEFGLENIAKTDIEKYKLIARQLELAGLSEANPLYQFAKFGWYKEKLFNKEFWKSEIDNSKMKINDFILNEIKNKISNDKSITSASIKLSDLIDHKELFESYPQLKDMNVRFTNNKETSSHGYFSNDGVSINLGAQGINPEETIIHEIQHAIQKEEGFWRGTSPDTFKDRLNLYDMFIQWRKGNTEVTNLINKNSSLKKDMIRISNGELPKLKDMDYSDIADEISSALNTYNPLTDKLHTGLEFYENSVGEGEARNVSARYLNPRLKDAYYPTTLAQTAGLLDERELIPNKSISSLSVGAYRGKSEYSPVDVSWFGSMLGDKENAVHRDNVVKMIQDIDDNYYKYADNTKDAIMNASEHTRDLVELWKNQYLKTMAPESSRYEKSELSKFLITPFRKNIQDYIKDVDLTIKFMSDADFKSSFDEAKKQQSLARNRFLRDNKDNVGFYMAVKNITDINLKMFETPKELNEFKDLVSTKISNTNVQDFIDKSKSVYDKYIEWKSQFNDQNKITGVDSTASDNSQLDDDMLSIRKGLASYTIKTLFKNDAITNHDRQYIDKFISIDTKDMDTSSFKDYEDILKQLVLNPTDADHKLIKFVNKDMANTFYDNSANELSQKYIDILNEKSLPDKMWGRIPIDVLRNNLTAMFPLIKFPKIERGTDGKLQFGWYDKLGNISTHNITTAFEVAEGFPKEQVGVLRKEINNVLDKNYQSYLRGVDSATEGISPFNKLKLSDAHLIGFHGLLSQRPDFKLSDAALQHLEDNSIDTTGLATKQILTHDNEDTKEAYEVLRQRANEMIKDSILISFGQKPDDTWTDAEIKSTLKDTAIMSQRSVKQIQEEHDNILEDSGADTMRELVDNISNGIHNLSDSQQEYLDMMRGQLGKVHDGEFSNGITLKDAAEKFTGTQFQEINNYFPMLRYKTYLTTKNYFDPEGQDTNSSKVFYGIYDDFHMNTSFLEQRKPSVMALNTNAYEAVRRRIDDQIFYLNHIEHQTYMYDVFRTPLFFSDKSFFNTELSNWIIGQMNGYYNKGINSGKAEMMKDPVWRGALSVIDNYKGFILGNPLRSPSILSTAIFSMSKLEGNELKKMTDMKSGAGSMLNSYTQDAPEEKFLRENAPEVYFRGLSAYDIATYHSKEGRTESGIMSDFLNRSAKGVLSGHEKGLYLNDGSAVGNIVKETFDTNSNFGKDVNLSGLIFFHRIAARTSFFAMYKNYCEKIGEDVDFESPNQDAVSYAINGVRETQNTDNPIHKTGIAYGNIAGGTFKGGDFLAQNLLAFRSYAINERNTLMKANEQMCNAFEEKDWDEFSKHAGYFAHSFVSKMTFQYIKLFCQKYLLSAVATNLLSNQNSEKVDEELDNATSFGNVALHSILDYYALNEVAKWGATLAIHKADEMVTGRKLNKDEEYKYKTTGGGIDGRLVSGVSEDIIDNLSKGTKTVASDFDKYGLNDQTTADASKLSLFLYSILGNNLPGGSAVSDLIKEVDKQRSMEKSKGKGKINSTSGSFINKSDRSKGIFK